MSKAKEEEYYVDLWDGAKLAVYHRGNPPRPVITGSLFDRDLLVQAARGCNKMHKEQTGALNVG